MRRRRPPRGPASCSCPTSAASTPSTWRLPSSSRRPACGGRPPAEAAAAEAMDSDIAAGLAYLRERAGADLPVVTVGFCLGGSLSWRQSGGDLDLAGCVGFYGRPSVVGDAAGRAHLPTVMLIAGADAATPVADQLALAETMRAAGADVDAVVYDGAPHSFFDRAFGEWADACRDAWQHVLALTDRVARR